LSTISRLIRTRYAAAAAFAVVAGILSAGCGDKKEAQTPPPAAPTTGAGAAAGPVQGKVTTGADPDKAPSYPNMYGKPAGSK
jgi:hypothetical protein